MLIRSELLLLSGLRVSVLEQAGGPSGDTVWRALSTVSCSSWGASSNLVLLYLIFSELGLSGRASLLGSLCLLGGGEEEGCPSKRKSSSGGRLLKET